MYKTYITDALKIIAENTAKSCPGGGSYLKIRYYDVVNEVSEPEPTETGEEIISRMKKKLSEYGGGESD